MTLPRALVLGAALLALANCLYSAWNQGWTYDEPFHLGWSERLLRSGESERASQQRFNSKTPVTLANVLARDLVERAGGGGERRARFFARLPGPLFLAATLGASYLLGRALLGPAPAALAAAALALDPNLQAHASLATVDAPYALATLLTLAAALRAARRPGAASGALLGLALGFAFAAKFTAVLLVLGLLLLPLAAPARAPRAWLAGLFAAAAACCFVICAAYLFLDVGRPLGAVGLSSKPLAALARALPWLGLPLPAAFLTGLDASLLDERGFPWSVVLFGRRYPDGVAWYFVVLWILKTPLALLAATLVGVARSRAVRSPELRFLLANLLLTLAYFSLFFRAQIGYRFVLMALPLVYLIAAAGWARSRHAHGPLAVAVALLALLEVAPYFGNPLAFTNTLVLPKRAAYRYLADSNLDWGQNRDKVALWMKQAAREAGHLDPFHLQAGHVVLGVNALAGVFDFEQHRWARENLEPAGHYGHSYVFFDVDDATFDRFMSEARAQDPTPEAETACPADLAYARHLPGDRLHFLRSEPPRPGRPWQLCVKAAKGVDLGFRVGDGRIEVGFGPCADARLQVLQERQVAWWRLTPGTHALCARELPNRREWLPYSFEGAWLVRGRGADLHLRQLGEP